MLAAFAIQEHLEPSPGPNTILQHSTLPMKALTPNATRTASNTAIG